MALLLGNQQALGEGPRANSYLTIQSNRKARGWRIRPKTASTALPTFFTQTCLKYFNCKTWFRYKRGPKLVINSQPKNSHCIYQAVTG